MKVTVNANATTTFSGAGAAVGSIYGTNSDFVSGNMCNLFKVDPKTFAEYTGSACSADYAILDMTDAPAMKFDTTDADGNATQKDAFGMPLYISNIQATLMLKDYVEGTLTGWNTQNYYSDLGAVAYIGDDTNSSGAACKDFVVLGADGTLYLFQITPTYTASTDTVGYSLARGVIGNIGVEFDNYQALSMECDGRGLIIADSSKGAADLYYVDLTAETLSCGKIGRLADATGISGLYSAVAASSAPAIVDAVEVTSLEKAVSVNASNAVVVENDDVEMSASVSMDKALASSKAAGSTNSVASYAPAASEKPVMPMSNKEVGENEKTVTLNVTAKDATGTDVASTNGVATVTYDPAAMTLTGVTVNGDYTSKVEAEGSVTFGYVKLDGFAAGDTVATLTFDIVDATEDDLVVSFKEVNNESGSDENIPASCPSAHLVDVDQNAWYHEGVDYVVENGLMVGVDETHFDPYAQMTRAQLITVLYRMDGSPDVSDVKTTFKDVQSGKYYADAVAWGVANGIVSGRSETVFAPDASVSRQDMVTFLYRYASYKGYDLSGDADLSVFTDGNKVAGYAADAMEWAVANGIISGTAEGKLEPNASATRAQTAAVLYRLSQVVSEN